MRKNKGFFLIESFVTALVLGGLTLLLLMGYGQSFLLVTKADTLNKAYNQASRSLAGKSTDAADFSVTHQTGDFKEVQVVKDGQVVLNFFTTP